MTNTVVILGGQQIDLENPDLSQVKMTQIAAQLCRMPRYNGATCRPYSVGEHSVRGFDAYWKAGYHEAAYQFLMHDAHEFLIGDIIRPVLRMPGVSEAIEPIKIRIDREIEKVYRVKLRDAEDQPLPRIRQMDRAMLYAERYYLFPNSYPINTGLPEGVEIAPIPTFYMSEDEIFVRFMDRYTTAIKAFT
jgi:uncharacterized protein